jgi:hypothetical protein
MCTRLARCTLCAYRIIWSTFIGRRRPFRHLRHPHSFRTRLVIVTRLSYININYKVTFTPGCKSPISQQCYYLFFISPWTKMNVAKTYRFDSYAHKSWKAPVLYTIFYYIITEDYNTYFFKRWEIEPSLVSIFYGSAIPKNNVLNIL